MPNPETELQDDIRDAIGTLPGVIVWRNNTGLATHCDCWRDCATPQACPSCGARLAPRGQLRRVRYGLAVGSSDLICCVDGAFLAGEVKTKGGRLSADQRNFIAAVQRAGGRAETWRSVEDACAGVEGARRWTK